MERNSPLITFYWLSLGAEVEVEKAPLYLTMATTTTTPMEI
ncbi:hypothetical protein [Mycoplasma suis]|nr:hypothetical protein [Mycoplasma suis]